MFLIMSSEVGTKVKVRVIENNAVKKKFHWYNFHRTVKNFLHKFTEKQVEEKSGKEKTYRRVGTMSNPG